MTWLMPRRAWDPLYGRMELQKEEFELLLTPELQRLRYIRMCNINSMLVTGASEISRFEHSLGVLRLVQEWLNHHAAPSVDARALRAAALLHDMQTGPFGHSLQYILEDNSLDDHFEHEDLRYGSQNAFYQALMANVAFGGRPFRSHALLGSLWDQVAEIIAGHGRLGPLIAGTMDLDNVDNIVRLAFHSGVATSDDATVALGLAQEMELSDGELSLSPRAIPLVERWQTLRRNLYTFLLRDWAEFSAKAMLTHAMELAVEAGVVGADSWRWTDDELMLNLERSGRGEGQEIGEIIKRLRCGELYEPIALLQSISIDAYAKVSSIYTKRAMERELSSFARSSIGARIRVILHFILDKAKTERAVTVHLRPGGQRVTIGANSSCLLIGIFVGRPLTPRQVDVLAVHARSLLEQAGLRGLCPFEDPMFPDAPTEPNQPLLL